MNIQIKIQAFFLLIVACTQCMESEILTLNSRIIRKFIKVNTENKFHIPGFNKEINRIVLLQQLADQGAHITFHSKDKEIPSWLHKDIDITQKILYKFFSFLRYNKNTAPIAAQYSCSEESEKSTHIFCFNNNVLWITTKKSINNEQQPILHLIEEYKYDGATPHGLLPDPDQKIIDAWQQYLQLIKNEIESIQPITSPPSMGSVCRDQGIFRLSNKLIEKLIKITRKPKPPHWIQLKKLKQLEQLVKEEVDITFNNEDLTCLLNQSIKTFNKTFYEKFFLFLNYDISSCQASVYHIFAHRKNFIATICLNNSLLHIVGSKRLLKKTEQELTDFLCTYRKVEQINKPLNSMKAEEQSTQSPQPIESSIDTQKTAQVETNTEIKKNEIQHVTIEGEIIELNHTQLNSIISKHRETNIVYKLNSLAEVYRFTKTLKMNL